MRVGTNLNLNPYNSFSNNEYQGSMQIPNQSSQNLDQRQSTFNNNEINFETENNIIETQNYESTYGNNNNTNNTLEKKEEEVVDSEEELFEEDKKKRKKELNKVDSEDDLSSYKDENEGSNDEDNFSNLLLSQYEKVKRVKNKWKVSLKGCIVQKDMKEYVCGKIHGELSREW